MRLWTIQTEQAFRQFERSGFLRGDGRRVDSDFRRAYAWMALQMEQRLGKPPGRSRTPVWAWKVWNARSAKPDLRSSSLLPRDAAGVRIEFEAPPETVLLSDFIRWHAVLNGHYLADDQAEDIAPPSWAFEDRHMHILRSWERIFDLERGDPDYFGPLSSRGVQATLWQVEWVQVRKVTPFTAR